MTGRPNQDAMLIRNAEAVMAGTVVCAAVIAAGAGHTTSIGSLCAAILLTVTVYWVAHLYSAALAGAIAHREHPIRAARTAALHSWPLAAASLLPLGVLVVSDALGAELKTAASAALVTTVALLATYGGIAGHRGGLGRRGVTVCVAGGAGLGLLLVVVKGLMH